MVSEDEAVLVKDCIVSGRKHLHHRWGPWC